MSYGRLSWKRALTTCHVEELVATTVNTLGALINSPYRAKIREDILIPIASDGSLGRYVLTAKGIQWEANEGNGCVTQKVFGPEEWPELVEKCKLTPNIILDILWELQCPLCVEERRDVKEKNNNDEIKQIIRMLLNR